MCGISGIFGPGWDPARLNAMVDRQRLRGPDGSGTWADPKGRGGLGHNRLSIIDLSDAGRQPMSDPAGRRHIAFNGEIYNYVELRRELEPATAFRTRTDTEVLLAALARWGRPALDRLLGMFAFAVWEEDSGTLFIARDRFGVKPVYYHAAADGTLLFASEIKALHAAGVPKKPDSVAWATYLGRGLYDHGERTFWEGIRQLPAGHALTWKDEKAEVKRWYDLHERIGDPFDGRSDEAVEAEYRALLEESVRLRFRSDVPVGVSLSGGLDSSTLLALVHEVQGAESEVKVFSFYTGDPEYDELPWVEKMLASTRHPLSAVRLEVADIPALAASVQTAQDEPFGGLPTLAYARLFERARAEGVIVILDGQGMDEQWAGYDYYVAAASGGTAGIVQGTKNSPVAAGTLRPEFLAKSEEFTPPAPFPDPVRNLQYRDARYTKIPRALRFNDRISMRSGTELREPFMDHRLFELAVRQPLERKIHGGQGKWFLRRLAQKLIPPGLALAPKRPLQTPQREWLRGPLKKWAGECIEAALAGWGREWLDAAAVRAEWRRYGDGHGDVSFFVWQWISIALLQESRRS